MPSELILLLQVQNLPISRSRILQEKLLPEPQNLNFGRFHFLVWRNCYYGIINTSFWVLFLAACFLDFDGSLKKLGLAFFQEFCARFLFPLPEWTYISNLHYSAIWTHCAVPSSVICTSNHIYLYTEKLYPKMKEL